jgi:hypothetical protein
MTSKCTPCNITPLQLYSIMRFMKLHPNLFTKRVQVSGCLIRNDPFDRVDKFLEWKAGMIKGKNVIPTIILDQQWDEETYGPKITKRVNTPTDVQSTEIL